MRSCPQSDDDVTTEGKSVRGAIADLGARAGDTTFRESPELRVIAIDAMYIAFGDDRAAVIAEAIEQAKPPPPPNPPVDLRARMKRIVVGLRVLCAVPLIAAIIRAARHGPYFEFRHYIWIAAFAWFQLGNAFGFVIRDCKIRFGKRDNSLYDGAAIKGIALFTPIALTLPGLVEVFGFPFHPTRHLNPDELMPIQCFTLVSMLGVSIAMLPELLTRMRLRKLLLPSRDWQVTLARITRGGPNLEKSIEVSDGGRTFAIDLANAYVGSTQYASVEWGRFSRWVPQAEPGDCVLVGGRGLDGPEVTALQPGGVVVWVDPTDPQRSLDREVRRAMVHFWTLLATTLVAGIVVLLTWPRL